MTTDQKSPEQVLAQIDKDLEVRYGITATVSWNFAKKVAEALRQAIKERDEALRSPETALDLKSLREERDALREKLGIAVEALRSIQNEYGSPEDEDNVTTTAREALAKITTFPNP